jgi:two-component system CheB/CheR fusion protein
LSKTAREPDHIKAVHELHDTVSVMGSLLDALLDVSKLDSGKITPKLTDFPIGELLERLRIEFANHARDKSLGLHVVSSSAVIRSDPVLLEHIVRNLLSNAIRYTSSGKVLLGCRRRGTNLRVEVRDTGVGIPPEQINTIFEEFYQLDNPARDRRKGWGLGLAITARSARLLGHRVDVHSVPGRGSTFAVEVPLGTAPGQPVQAGDRGAVAGNNHQEANIFLIEDEKAVRDATCCMLRLYDFRVNAAANSEEAYQQLQILEVAPDLIIADYRLPLNRTGIDVVRTIRKRMDAGIPGIILTGDISPNILREARANHLAVIHKPVDPDELLALINEKLGSDPSFS